MAPEYQGGGTWIERDHPDLFLTLKDEEVSDLPPFKILNFGDKRALKMITDYISDLIQKEGIGIYRQDGPIGANFSYPDQRPYPNGQPLQWWRDADAPDRQGITEIHYIEGLYWFWDELLKKILVLLLICVVVEQHALIWRLCLVVFTFGVRIIITLDLSQMITSHIPMELANGCLRLRLPAGTPTPILFVVQ